MAHDAVAPGGCRGAHHATTAVCGSPSGCPCPLPHENDIDLFRPLAPTIPITSCVGNNLAVISAWPISQAFSFGAGGVGL